MGLRFRKSFKILPGVRINLSKSGLSTSLGVNGAKLNIGKKGKRTTIGIPGSGLSFSNYQPNDSHEENLLVTKRNKKTGCMPIIIGFFVLAGLSQCFGHSSTSNSIISNDISSNTNSISVTESETKNTNQPTVNQKYIPPPNSNIDNPKPTYSKLSLGHISTDNKKKPIPKPNAKNGNKKPSSLNSACPCGSGHICIGPRGGRYCLTSGGIKDYGH